jgi:hypothetical protein
MLLPSHKGSFICNLPESHFNSPMKLSKKVRTVSIENDLMNWQNLLWDNTMLMFSKKFTCLVADKEVCISIWTISAPLKYGVPKLFTTVCCWSTKHSFQEFSGTTQDALEPNYWARGPFAQSSSSLCHQSQQVMCSEFGNVPIVLPPNDSKSDLEFEIEIVILWKNLRTNWSSRDTASQQHIVDGHWKEITAKEIPPRDHALAYLPLAKPTLCKQTDWTIQNCPWQSLWLNSLH